MCSTSRFVPLVLRVLAGVASAVSISPEAAAGQQPNIIVMVADDLGFADIGYNNPNVYSPNLDALAAAGVRFSQHYSMSQCTPTRVALMTGQFPSRHGYQAQKATNVQCFSHDTPTIHSMLDGLGYDTFMTGKWHVGCEFEWGPMFHGFDSAHGSLAGAVGMYDHRYRPGNAYEITWFRDHEIIDGYENGTHATDLTAREAIRFIQKQRDKPFYLYLPWHAPHTPLDERGPFVDTPTQLDPANPSRWLNEDQIEWFNDPDGKIQSETDPEKRLFLAVVNHLDHAIGQIIKTLEDTGQRQNTLIYFSSDNGPQVSWAGNAYPDDLNVTNFNQPDSLRGSKTDVYEGGILVPGFINWPAKIESRVVDEPVHVVDLLPTLANMVGIDPDPEWDGADLAPLIKGTGTLGERTLYWLWNDVPETSRSNRWALRHGDWKVVEYGPLPDNPGDWQLFNLASDPGETNDLASSEPAKLAEMHAIFLSQRGKDNTRTLVSPLLQAPASASGAFTVTLKFNTPVSGVTLDDFAIEGGNGSGFSGSGSNYQFTVTPNLAGPGDITIKLQDKAASTSDGRSSTPSQTEIIKYDPSSTTGAAVLGPFGRGIAARDDATDSGFIMYSLMSVHQRFATNPVNPFQANHFVAVRHGAGGWTYDNNESDLGGNNIPFTPVVTDILVASVDFGNNTVTMLDGTDTVTNGIATGYASGDLNITPELWDGSPNVGEFGVNGTTITLNAGEVIGP